MYLLACDVQVSDAMSDVLADDTWCRVSSSLGAMDHAVMTGKQNVWCRCIMWW